MVIVHLGRDGVPKQVIDILFSRSQGAFGSGIKKIQSDKIDVVDPKQEGREQIWVNPKLHLNEDRGKVTNGKFVSGPMETVIQEIIELIYVE